MSITMFPFLCYSQDIHPDKTGSELLSLLIQDYKPNQVLTYAMARDTMYKNIYRDDDGFVSCFYSGHSVHLPDDVNPRFHLAMDGDDDGINTEHIYPQSKGAGDGNARSDMHHLVPTRWAVNEARSNYPFSEIDDNDTDVWFWQSAESSTIPSDNIDEYSERLNGSFGPGLFEPRESVKGDIARSVFYFYTMYKSEADNEDPDYFASMLPTLLEWHHQDPADEMETERTYLKAEYQDDKPNPYILDCTLASRAYGDGSGCSTSTNSNISYIQKSYVYPNPVDGFVSIYGMRTDADQLKIHTIEGDLIQTINSLSAYDIDVSGYMAGTYILSLYRKGKRIDSMKFVKG